MLKFKGYCGIVTKIDFDAGVLHGKVILAKGLVTFQADSVKNLVKEFKASVEDYLDFCRQDGVSPERPLTGEILVRCGQDLQVEVIKIVANRKFGGEKISQNEWCKNALKAQVEKEKVG